MQQCPMQVLLEVIATSLVEALEAERGGADRIELVRALEMGGLTPPLAITQEVVNAVKIPVRVMVRENSGLAMTGPQELELLARQVEALSDLRIDGLVLGFASAGELDLHTTRTLLAKAPRLRATFHKAFNEARDPIGAICMLKQIPQIDRILTDGGAGNATDRISRLRQWQRLAAPQIQLLIGIGLSEPMLDLLKGEPLHQEVHVGRAARIPENVAGKLHRDKVASLKRALS
jgi:copper homeostasis protein